MKKLIWLILFIPVLAGCTASETFETLMDTMDMPAMATVQSVSVSLPEEAVSTVLQNDSANKLYFCDGYTVSVQTMAGGDLDRTLRQCTGFGRDGLTMLERQQGTATRYEAVWCAAGEGNEQICRCVLLDDGSYHYAVTVMAEAEQAGELTAVWQHILDSVTLHTG